MRENKGLITHSAVQFDVYGAAYRLPGEHRMHYEKKASRWSQCDALLLFCWETLGPVIHVDVQVQGVDLASKLP